MNRRTFLKIAGMGSLAFAASCTPESEKYLFSNVKTPDDRVSGTATWYASTCRQCPAGCGVLAKNREGRVIKLEGNPLHPVNKGALCMRGQAALQQVYHPDRLKTPILRKNGKWQEISYHEAARTLKAKIRNAAAGGKDRIRMLTETEGRTRLSLFESCLSSWASPGPLVFETFSHDNLKKANAIVFGVDGLPAYCLDRCDFLLSFGADFLETWLSPVAYARGFKKMHGLRDGRKNMFVHAGPKRTLTGANADSWLACPPGSEALVCMGLIRTVIDKREGAGLPNDFMAALHRASAPHTLERIAEQTGISKEQFDYVCEGLLKADHPLVLGPGAASHGDTDLGTHIAVNLLNVLLDPSLRLLDFQQRHRIETAADRAAVETFLASMDTARPQVLLLNHVNPLYSMPPGLYPEASKKRDTLFIVSFSNFLDDTSAQANLVFPVALPLETWGEYSAHPHLLSLLQPTLQSLNGAPHIEDVFIELAEKRKPLAETGKHFLIKDLEKRGWLRDTPSWLAAVRAGGIFTGGKNEQSPPVVRLSADFEPYLKKEALTKSPAGLTLLTVPSIRFYDGRDAHLPWLLEIPDPLTKVAWQTIVMLHPDTARANHVSHGDRVRISRGKQTLTALVFETDNLIPGLAAMHAGQGHTGYGRYAENRGANPFKLMPRGTDPVSGAGLFRADGVAIEKIGSQKKLARTDGSSSQHDRKIALTTTVNDLKRPDRQSETGLAMNDFPLTLPIPSGYDPRRDFYPPHDHTDYRWCMVVDLDRCVGCNACSAACYAENNLGVMGEEQVIKGREMSWMRIERYRRIDAPEQLIFLPMLCQHCDNAPCESVCPVYAPHHSKEGLNNQIYNRCIGTRFCAQNCPYKVRRFNWFDPEWPPPLNLQLNPDVTVRSKGVMEKCSFCIQRIKAAHGNAKNRGRMIKDGEVIPACVQTCPTGALVFGSLMDAGSRVSRMVRDPRAYQVLGYLNTKPAVIYLKKVVHAVQPLT